MYFEAPSKRHNRQPHPLKRPAVVLGCVVTIVPPETGSKQIPGLRPPPFEDRLQLLWGK